MQETPEANGGGQSQSHSRQLVADVRLKAGDIFELLAALPLYAIGWLVGVFVRGLLWLWAALVAGYEVGRHG